jgi:hypothetical protein
MKLLTPKIQFDALKVTELVDLKCEQCHSIFHKEKREAQKVIKHQKTKGYKKKWLCFCNHSCHSKYVNSHKKTGSNRSKLECWLELQLTKIYPSLKILYNKRNEINAELDIHIPSLKLAFELNGIFHYEPIFGNYRLKSAQTNDKRKFQACLERQIELCIIDVSHVHGKFTDVKGEKFLTIIRNLIESKMASPLGIEPSS